MSRRTLSISSTLVFLALSLTAILMMNTAAQAQSATPTRTPTRTATSPAPTRTRTATPVVSPGTPSLTPSPTNTSTAVPGVCSPAIPSSSPYTRDGAGVFCLQFSNISTGITFYNFAKLTINGVDFTSWGYVPVSAFPPKINGYWYIYYISNYAWGHFEAR